MYAEAGKVNRFFVEGKGCLMIIKAVKFVEKGFYAQGMIFGGEEGPQNFDDNIRYRGSLQNYVIDTGEDVIFVDTGVPKEMPDAVYTEIFPTRMRPSTRTSCRSCTMIFILPGVHRIPSANSFAIIRQYTAELIHLWDMKTLRRNG